MKTDLVEGLLSILANLAVVDLASSVFGKADLAEGFSGGSGALGFGCRGRGLFWADGLYSASACLAGANFGGLDEGGLWHLRRSLFDGEDFS